MRLNAQAKRFSNFVNDKIDVCVSARLGDRNIPADVCKVMFRGGLQETLRSIKKVLSRGVRHRTGKAIS